jgi:hypothetical protein
MPFDSVLGTTLIHRPVINALVGTGNYHRELGLSQDIVVINTLFGRQSDYLYTDTVIAASFSKLRAICSVEFVLISSTIVVDFFYFIQYKRKYLYIYMSIHPYEYIYAHPTSMSTSKRLC